MNTMKLTERLKNWKNTLLGLVPAAIAILGFTDVIKVDSDGLTDQVNSIFNFIMEGVASVTAIILFYKRDAPPEAIENE